MNIDEMAGKNKSFQELKAFAGDPAEARTLDPQIKSLLLYQLSYGVKGGSKCMTIKKPGKELSKVEE